MCQRANASVASQASAARRCFGVCAWSSQPWLLRQAAIESAFRGRFLRSHFSLLVMSVREKVNGGAKKLVHAYGGFKLHDVAKSSAGSPMARGSAGQGYGEGALRCCGSRCPHSDFSFLCVAYRSSWHVLPVCRASQQLPAHFNNIYFNFPFFLLIALQTPPSP